MTAESNPLWDYAVASYARPGVAPLLLKLQEEHDADVMLLLAAAWCAENRRSVSAALAARWWSETADSRRLIAQQRALRRELKRLAPGHDIYVTAKGFEQALERWQSEQLQVLQPVTETSEETLLSANLSAVMRQNGDDVRGLLAQLARLLSADARA